MAVGLSTKAQFPRNHSLVFPVGILIYFYFELNVICRGFLSFFHFPSLAISLPSLGYTIMLNCTHSKYSFALNMSSKNINMKGFCMHTKHTAELFCQLFVWFQLTAENYCFKYTNCSYTNKHPCEFLWILHSELIHSFYSREKETVLLTTQ